MQITGSILQACAFLVGIGGIFGGFAVALSTRDGAGQGAVIGVSSIIGALILYGIGGAFHRLDDIADHTARTAAAMEALVRSRRQ